MQSDSSETIDYLAEALKKWETGGVGYLHTLSQGQQISLRELVATDTSNSTYQVLLGDMYQHGLGGLPEDDEQVVRLYKLSADGNNSFGQARLGLMYLQGLGGLPEDKQEAVRLFKLSADGNNSCGQAYLGAMYLQGLGGLPVDKKKAVRLYKLSADGNNSDGQLLLGTMYECGLGGLSVDKKEAVRLYKLSAMHDNPLVKKNLDRLKSSNPELFREPKCFNQPIAIASDAQCRICLDEFIGSSQSITILSCSHMYHCDCLSDWWAGKPKICPTCKYVV